MESYDNEDGTISREDAADFVMEYGDLREVSSERVAEVVDPGRVAEVVGLPGAEDQYNVIAQDEPDLYNRLVDNIMDVASRSDRTEIENYTAEESWIDSYQDDTDSLRGRHPKAVKAGVGALFASGLLAGCMGPAEEDQSPAVENNEDASISMNEVDGLLSESNMSSDDLVASYLGENISEEHTDDVYSVFDGELLNGSELTQKMTDDDGRIKDEYVKDEYKNGSSLFSPNETDLFDVLDKDRIIEDVENESTQVSDLRGDISEVEQWYDGQYENEIVEGIAEDELNASAEDVTVVSEGGNYTVTGTFQTDQGETYEQIDVNGSVVEESKEDFRTVLQGLDTVRTLDSTNTEKSTELTDNYISELEAGNFDRLQDAREVGQTYEDLNSTSTNVTEATVLEGYLQNETTDRELSELATISERNSTRLVNSVEDPLSDDWAGNGTDNLALMDLGLDPMEDHDVLSDYNITRDTTSENATNNTYVIQETGDGEGFTSNVTTGQLNTFSPAMQDINEEYQNPSEVQDSELFDEDKTNGELMTGLLDFSFNYMDNADHTDTVKDISQMSLIEDGDLGYGDASLLEKVSHFNTFDGAWENPDDAMKFGRMMVTEDNLEDANDAGLNLLDPTYRQAAEDGFSYDNDERLTGERMEELKDEATGWNGELKEPNLEPDELYSLDDSGGGGSTNSGGGDDGGGDNGGGNRGGGGPGTGGPGVGLLPLIGGRKIWGSRESEESIIENIKWW